MLKFVKILRLYFNLMIFVCNLMDEMPNQMMEALYLMIKNSRVDYVFAVDI